jgi:opacity protein-like surface antigen
MKLKKLIPAAVLSVGLLSSANAGWVVSPYMGASAGFGRQTVYSGDLSETSSARSYGAMLGLDLPLISIEGEYNYLDANNLEANIAMLNAYLKIPSVIVKPYIGAGFGTMFGGTETESNTDLKSTSAYQGMIGAAIDILKLPIKPEIEARVLYVPNIIDNGFAQPDLLQYEARLKVKYVF